MNIGIVDGALFHPVYIHSLVDFSNYLMVLKLKLQYFGHLM